ncbi:MAG: Hercynine oxygenase [Syntrophus sp. SKADARSKE-3]|nr:Hercynine oxygenase [Syntrophus sp. SKADARSKE-3]
MKSRFVIMILLFMSLMMTHQLLSDAYSTETPQKALAAQKIKKAHQSGHAVDRAEIFVEPITGMMFIFVKGGCFQMGDTFGDGDSNERPVHKVCIDDLYVGKYKVTQKQWRTLMGNNPSSYGNEDDYPVDSVSWNDANDFVKKMNNKTGKIFRLPTEAEWEYAARSGGKKEKYAGFSEDSQIYRYGNFCDINCDLKTATTGQNDGYKNTSPVGSYQPNGLGLYDMTGNVWEWCSDWYGIDYYKESPSKNPQGPPKETSRVLRGGSWGSIPAYVRTTNRGYSTPEYRDSYIGFRLVMPLK